MKRVASLHLQTLVLPLKAHFAADYPGRIALKRFRAVTRRPARRVSTGSGSDRVSPRSGRWRKAWGVSPRDRATNNHKPALAGDRAHATSVARFAGSHFILANG